MSRDSPLDQSLPRRSSSTEGPPSHRPSTETSPNPNVFSDDYAIDRPDGIIAWPRDHNAFEGAENGQTTFTQSPFDDSLAFEPVNATHIPDLQRGSFDSFHDVRNDFASAERPPPSPSIAPSESQRSMSTISRFSVPHVTSPHTGPTGPSHAYSMYSQEVGLGRMNSTSTTSTTRPTDRGSGSLRATAPQHPYLMYPQNTVPEDILEQEPAIPVGFPGHGMACAQLPNEVGDIVGPDGHTEQLPPYSRYAPEEYKSAEAAAHEDDTAAPAPAPAVVGATTVTPPVGIATSLPAPPPPVAHAAPNSLAATASASTDETAAIGRSRDASQSPLASGRVPPAGAAVAGGEAAGDGALALDSDDPSGNFKEGGFKEKLTDAGRKRVCCGIPIFMLLLVAIVLCIGAGIGGAIGGVLGTRQGVSNARAAANATASHSPTSIVTVTTTLADSLDATPVSDVPAGLPSLIPGSYLIHLNDPKKASTCLDSDYDVTWQCREDVTVPARIGRDSSSGDTTISFSSPSISGNFDYGPQYPIFRQKKHNLTMGIELNRPDLGPGLYFETDMDKLVIIPNSEFPSDEKEQSELSYRDLERRAPSWSGTSSKPGDKPWFCWWNSTVFETFVFLNKSTGAADQMQSTATATTTTGNFIYMQSPPTPSGWSTLSTSPKPEATASSESVDNFWRSSSYTSFFNHPIRMIERRKMDTSSSSSVPFCEQLIVLDNGSLAQPSGGKYVQLAESKSSNNKRSLLSTRTKGRLYARGDDDVEDASSSDCYCEWFNG